LNFFKFTHGPHVERKYREYCRQPCARQQREREKREGGGAEGEMTHGKHIQHVLSPALSVCIPACVHWCVYTGVCTLVCVHWCVYIGVCILECVHWCGHSRYVHSCRVPFVCRNPFVLSAFMVCLHLLRRPLPRSYSKYPPPHIHTYAVYTC